MRQLTAAQLRVLGTKRLLRAMAERGDPAPKRGITELGRFLHNHCCPGGKLYDPELSEYLRELRPDWFLQGWPGARRRTQEHLDV